MQTDNSKINELKQKLNMVISTFYNIYGIIPSAADLYYRLGSEYSLVIEEYLGSLALNFV